MFRRILAVLAVVAFAICSVGAFAGAWAYFFLIRDLPRLSKIEDYKPPAVSRLLARDGTLIAEFMSERRYPVKIRDVPDVIKKAFLAAEDVSFYSHSGIDPTSILRAVYKNLQTGNVSQGGSTITQQVVKNLLLTPERNITRKVKEAILAYRLERRFSKDEILEIYLNQIFFGNTAHGIRAAARAYFHKELPEVTLAEAAILAGLPKAPTRYSPLISMTRAKRRQRYVLQQMAKANFITDHDIEEASKEPIRVYPVSQQNIFASPYYVGEVRRLFADQWKDYDLDSDGLEITAAVDINADKIGTKALRRGLREVDKRRGWRGPKGHMNEPDYLTQYGSLLDEPVELGEPYPALVLSAGKGGTRVRVGSKTLSLDLSDAGWARRFLDREDNARGVNPADLIRSGDMIEISFDKVGSEDGGADHIVLDQTPEIEGAVALIDPTSGEVWSMIGGYNYGSSQFNRVTQSLRQPGSAFKPVVYLAALDKFKYTPATIVYDTPRTFRAGDTFWTPANFDEKFLGPITLRTALEKSRNLVSADIVSRIGVDAPIQYARLLGITSPLGRNLSLSLGSSEVSLLEMSRAYGVLDNKGMLFDSAFILKIRDRFGNVVYDYDQEKLGKAKQVLNENSAFVMTNMMRGVVEHGTGYKAKELGRPVAGKTGTSNDQMDAWFIGFTPSWVCGVWVGFDQKRQIGPKETGGVVAAPIWLTTMRDFLQYKATRAGDRMEEESRAEAERLGIEYTQPKLSEVLDFPVPEGVEPFWIYKSSGVRAEPGAEGAFLEYFVKGTEPEKYASSVSEGGEEADASSYLESPDL